MLGGISYNGIEKTQKSISIVNVSLSVNYFDIDERNEMFSLKWLDGELFVFIKAKH